MIRLSLIAAIAALASVPTAVAQTFTNCNPLKTTCPGDLALGTSAWFNFTSSQANPYIWNSTSTPINYGKNGQEFKITSKGDSPTIKTNFYFFFGVATVIMKASPGSGICSSIVLLSDDLDEVDWEILGGNKTVVESNYFGKGNSSDFLRAIYHPISSAPQDSFHNYTIVWTAERLDWFLDGNNVRTLMYDEAVGGQNYPQTPMQLSFGSWAPGDPSESQGTREWAQGTTDYTKGPYSMYVKSVYVQDYTNGSSYTYSDHSGAWQSIKVQDGPSPVLDELKKPYGVGAHWATLSQGVKIAIIAGSIAGLVCILGLITWFCIKTVRKGRREHEKAEADWAVQQREANEWRQRYQQNQTSLYTNSQRSLTSSHGYK